MADGRKRFVLPRLDPLVVTAYATFGTCMLWILMAILDVPLPLFVGWVPTLTVAALATAACLRVSRRADLTPAGRRFWALTALAIGHITVGAGLDITTTGPPVNGVGPPPHPITLVVYLGGVLAMLWALLTLPGRARLTRSDQRRFIMDAVIVTMTASLFLWQLSFRRLDQWDNFGGTPAVLVVLVLGFVAVLSFLKLTLVGVAEVDRRALHLLALAVGAGALGGGLSPLLVAHVSLQAACMCVPPVSLGFVLAAERQRRAMVAATEPRTELRRFSVLPYMAVAATDALLLANAGDQWVISGVAVALTIVVMARQIFALRTNAQLLHQVDASVRELEQVHSQLEHQAHHDSLTSLANRRRFEDVVGALLGQRAEASVILIDLDDFKMINDRLGHLVGDKLLIVVAERLRSCVRSVDTVARLGGDEFALLLPGTSVEAATAAAERIAAALSRPINVDGHDLLVRASVGVSEIGPQTSGIDPNELLRRADVAMYVAKAGGKARHAVYLPSFDQQAANDAQLGADLQLALDRGEFRMVYQPIVRLPDGRPAGGEALARWDHPVRGPIRPDIFIAAAERTGLIVPLGAWILDEACRVAASWLYEHGVTGQWWMGVNISARELSEPGFADGVAAVLARHRLPAERLSIEVTETAVFDNATAAATITDLKALGVSIALDDFGTGHSSLGLLRQIPVDVIKVDKSFVDRITESSADATIATAMFHLAKGLSLGAVAEGVETQAQADVLHQLGYHYAQGYHFARPMPAEGVAALLVNDAQRQIAA